MRNFWQFVEQNQEMVDFLSRYLTLNGYGAQYVMYTQEPPALLSPEQAKAIIVHFISPMPEYAKAWDYTKNYDNLKPTHYAPEVEMENGNLIFSHMKFSLPLQIPNIYVGKKPPAKNKQPIPERASSLGEEDYLLHANQCGYLLKNTRLLFERSPKMWAVSVRTYIKGLQLGQLGNFVDANGKHTLDPSQHTGAAISDEGGGIDARYKEFAIALIDFMGLDFIIDINGMADYEFNQPGANSGNLSLQKLGVSPELMLQQLNRGRPHNIEEEYIKLYFEEGYNGKLQ